MVSGTASVFHTFSGEIVLIRFEFWPLILTLFSPAWTWLDFFIYKTPYSVATLYKLWLMNNFFFHCFCRLYCSSSSKRFTNCEIHFIYLEPQMLCRPVICSQVSILSTFKENEHFPAKANHVFLFWTSNKLDKGLEEQKLPTLCPNIQYHDELAACLFSWLTPWTWNLEPWLEWASH